MLQNCLSRPVSQGLLTGAVALVLTFGALAGASAAPAGPAEPAKSTKPSQALAPMAKVSGRTITQGDALQAGAADLAQLDREYDKNRHTLIENKVKQLVLDTMLDAEAKEKGVTKDQLVADATKAAPVTEAEIEKFYEDNRAQIPPSVNKAQALPKVKEYLEQLHQNQARAIFYAALEAKYKAEYLLEPNRVPVDAASYPVPVRGPAAAPVTIVEFSDFECPFCSRLAPTLKQVEQKYGDKVKVVFRQYPMDFHEHASKAAEAALCANDQGKFWELHDAMFGDQSGLAVGGLKFKATKIAGLKADEFNSCLDSGKHQDEVKKDIAAGAAAGIGPSTPALFINGRFILGAVPLEDITKVVDDELKRVATAATAATKS
jgi:protein-disulfide isomerase